MSGFSAKMTAQVFLFERFLRAHTAFIRCNSIISHEYLATSNTKLYPCFIKRTLNHYESVISEKTKRNREIECLKKFNLCKISVLVGMIIPDRII